MARPQKEGLEYFPHDVYASSDEKIEPLILLYGARGYSFYFLHLEYIYRNHDFTLDISDAETRQVICQKLHINTEEYDQILQSALRKHCFDKDYYEKTGRLTSNGVKKRASMVTEKRDKMRAAYENRKIKVSDTETKEETTPETPQSKVKESKVKESKVKESKVKESNIYTPEFELFYSTYPRADEKRRTFTNWKTCLKSYSIEDLMKACIFYKAKVEREKTAIKYIKTSANFLGKEKPFESYLGGEEFGTNTGDNKQDSTDYSNFKPTGNIDDSGLI